MTTMTPRFAVVGHPNKGKSSIVATLAQDDTVPIAPTPGTTVRCQHFPMRVDGEVIFELIDTPGFQRARRALEWMKQRETSAADRPRIVREFVETHRGGDLFVDECELLGALVDGAAILYVVDGSAPYGSEYEAEMEILRWTGQPSMGLINPIAKRGDHIAEWTAALGQYFKIVRVFDPLTAEFEKRMELLKAFGELREDWREPLARAVQSLVHDRSERRLRSARVIAQMLVEMIGLVLNKRIRAGVDPERYRAALLEQYQSRMRALEQSHRREVESIYDYRRVHRHEPELEVLDEDLFSTRSLMLWGLTPRQLIATGALGGAAIGTGVDVALGGASLALGAGLGGVIGAASAWITGEKIAEVKVMGLALGGMELSVGPMRNLNFPYVILGRAVLHQRIIETRTHARRDELDIDAQTEMSSAKWLAARQRKHLERLFARIRKGAGDHELIDTLAYEVKDALGNVPAIPARQSPRD